MISCCLSLFLVANVLFGRVGTGGVEWDEREIQERASEMRSEMHRLSLCLLYTSDAADDP